MQVFVTQPSNKLIATTGLNHQAHYPPVLNEGRSNFEVRHAIVNVLGSVPDLVGGNDGGAYHFSCPFRVPPAHRGEHAQVKEIGVRHLRCLWLPRPALLSTEVSNKLREGSVLVRPGLVALENNMAIFVLLARTDKVENRWENNLLEYEEQRAFRILFGAFVRSSNATINKKRLSFPAKRFLWCPIGVGIWVPY